MYSILVVDDEPDNFDVIETFLSEQGYQLHYAASGQAALSFVNAFEPDLILLDVMMAGMDGIQVCQRIKSIPKCEGIPIIVITALTGKKDLAKCLSAGADDFISKPVNRLELNSRIRSMLRIREQYKQLTNFNASLEVKIEKRTAQLQQMLYEDELTQLPSRKALLQDLTQALAVDRASTAVVFLDCDQFKLVNGSFGHMIGNQLLISISERLQQHLRSGDKLARMGEDEFCFLLHQIEEIDELQPFIDDILKSFETPFSVADFEIFITACLGIALGNHQHSEPEQLLQDADTAMYQAKLRGKGSYQLFDPQMHVSMLNRLTLESDLKRALEQQEFILYYQPIINLQTQVIDGFEALVRWKHPLRGMVSPAEFIPYMETTGLIVPVGMLILKQACEQLYRWENMGWGHLSMSVNLSARQFSCPTLLADIDNILTETNVNPSLLKLEITESGIMDNAQLAIAPNQSIAIARNFKLVSMISALAILL